MSALNDLGISREDILDKAAEKLLESFENENESMVDSIRQRVVNDIVSQARPKIDDILNDALNGLVDASFTPVDEWGDPIHKKSTTLREMVKERASKFLSERVNKDGEATSYNAVGSRGEWMARKAATDAMTHEVRQELTKAVESAKSELQQQVAKHIADVLMKK